MTKFVKNPQGTVHSVDDGFVISQDMENDGWETATEKDAAPALLGKKDDTAVSAVASHDGASQPVPISQDNFTAPGTHTPVAEAVPSGLPVVFPDGKLEGYPNGTDQISHDTPVGEIRPKAGTDGEAEIVPDEVTAK